MERLFPGDVDEDQAWLQLKSLLQARIAQGLAGKVSGKGFDQIVDEELAKGRGD